MLRQTVQSASRAADRQAHPPAPIVYPLPLTLREDRHHAKRVQRTAACVHRCLSGRRRLLRHPLCRRRGWRTLSEAAQDLPRPIRRWCAWCCPCRRHQGLRGTADPGRLHRGYEHGGACRCGLRFRDGAFQFPKGIVTGIQLERIIRRLARIRDVHDSAT